MAVKQLLLDTSAYAAFMSAQAEAVDALRKADAILLPVIVLGELYGGFAGGSRLERNRAELTEFLKVPRVMVVPLVEATAERYALIYDYLRRNGRPIPTNDLWIAASAMEHGATLLTADAHFLRLPQILVQHIAVDRG